MPPKREPPYQRSLARDGITFKKRNELPYSPPELQTLFKLVVDVKDISYNRFGGFETKGSPLSAPPKLSPRQKYEKELKNESRKLDAACGEPHAGDYPEVTWMKTLQPIVFHRFDRGEEERFSRARHHHCFVCRKNYPFKSRPPINRRSFKVLDDIEGTMGKDRISDLCTLSSKQHFNLPNFCTFNQLSYPKVGESEKKIPDLTIGLHAYNLEANEWWNQETIENERIAPFDQRLLQELEEKKMLTLPVEFPKSRERLTEPDLTFPFAIWEAKRERGGYDHGDGGTQNARKVKELLYFQDDIRLNSAISWTPLVWMFVSVGSSWEVYGCYLQKQLQRTASSICVLMSLWTGDSAIQDEALQLLYLVDIIALWGEHCYKPFAGACIQRLAAKLKSEQPPEEEDLLAHQLSIDDATFPWLFSERDAVPHDRSLLRAQREIKRRRSQKTLASRYVQDQDTLPDMSKLSLGPISWTSIMPDDDSILPFEPSSNTYVIPERDCYLWFLNRARKDIDLLVIRIRTDGTVFKPLLLFAGATWEHEQFESLIEEEDSRRPAGISTSFTLSQAGIHYIRRCIRPSPGYFCDPELQFCAIFPLSSKEYKKQRKSTKSKITSFERLESKLDIGTLLEAAEYANARMCECEAEINEHTKSIIRCDNHKCPVGWYHQKCVGLPIGFESKRVWICKRCKGNPKSLKLGDAAARKANESADEELLEASDDRIHRAKTFLEAWKAHSWPAEKRIMRWFSQISCRIEVDADDTHETVSYVKNKNDKNSEYWAILKSNPKLMMPIESLDATDLTK